MVNRYSSAGSFRYGFNGKEKDNEDYGEGNSYDYGFRVYNPRLGNILVGDIAAAAYAELTPYQFASNSPIAGIDEDGLELGPPWYLQDDVSRRAYIDNAPKVYKGAAKGFCEILMEYYNMDCYDALLSYYTLVK